MKVGLVICIFLSGACYGQWEYQSMHFPQTPKAGGWDIGPRNNTFRAADDFRCSKTGDVTNVIFWVSWQQDHVGTLDNFLITIFKDSIKTANLVWKGSADLEYYPDRSKFDFTMKRMLPARQGWFDAVDFSPLFPDYGFWLDDHEKWEQIDAHNFQVPPRLEQGVTYWLKIDADEMGMFDPNYVDDGNDVFPTIGWKESDQHFGSSAKIWCDPCSGWKVMADPLTNGVIDLAFVIVTAPPPGDITKDGYVNNYDLLELAANWLNEDINCIEKPYCDLNGDCSVNTKDFVIVASNWLK